MLIFGALTSNGDEQASEDPAMQVINALTKGNPVCFQSFLGISKGKQKVVVVLSNVIAYDDDENAFADLIGYYMLCM